MQVLKRRYLWREGDARGARGEGNFVFICYIDFLYKKFVGEGGLICRYVGDILCVCARC